MNNKATSWIEAGIKILAETGKIELNAVCRERGRSKSSFYHIYPNQEFSRGLDRYENDLFLHHERVLADVFRQIRKIYIIYSQTPELITEMVVKLGEFHDYHRCSAQIRRQARHNPKMGDYWERIYNEYMNLLNDFYKVQSVSENSTLNNHELRLLLDSFLTFQNEDFIEDGINIISLGLQLRKQ